MSPASPFGASDAQLPAIIRQQSPDSHARYEHAADGAPLVITFGFFDADGPADFTFLGRMKKLEAITGRPLNKLLLRDPAYHWYLGGIQGLGVDVPSTLDAIRELIDFVRPSSVIMTGQSMGAFGAILYGTLMEVDKVVAFGTISAFERGVWDVIGETRWIPELMALEQSGVARPEHVDLPPLVAAATGRPVDIDLIYGRFAGHSVHPHDAVGVDAAHASRFIDVPGVTLLPVAASAHAVVEYFRARGVITEVLSQRIFGSSLMPQINELRQDPWVAWMLENVVRGVLFDTLRPTLLAEMPADEADYWIDRTQLLLELARLEDAPPSPALTLSLVGATADVLPSPGPQP
jgi:hypothetical protein